MQKKVVIKGKVEKKDKKKFKVKAHKKHEVDFEIEIEEDGDYEVEKLSVDDLPKEIEGKPITWLNHFAVKKAGKYIKQKYKVKIQGLGNKRVVIVDTSNNGAPYFYTDPVENDTLMLFDGDPGIGHT